MNRRSFWALNGLNFLLAQIAAVVVPFLNVFLKQKDWRYDQIGFAMAVVGMGSVIFQIPAGMICDRFSMPKKLLAIATISLGLAYVLIPYAVNNFYLLVPLLFVSGMMGTFFAPLLSTLALSMVGRLNLPKILGTNQSWGHLGGVGASLVAAMVVSLYGIQALFYLAGAISLVAAGTIFMLGNVTPIDPPPPAEHRFMFFIMAKRLMQNRDICIFLFCAVLFYLATGPSAPTVGLYMKHLGSTDDKIAWISLVAQPIMIPVAWLTGKFAVNWGRKPLMLIAMFALFLRFLLYAIAHSVDQVLLITTLDGITSGVASLVIVLICSDLTHKKGMFNSLMGFVNSVPAIGTVVGVSLQGLLTQHYGFHVTFYVFAGISFIAAMSFLFFVPETHQLVANERLQKA
jgi:MFS family permease